MVAVRSPCSPYHTRAGERCCHSLREQARAPSSTSTPRRRAGVCGVCDVWDGERLGSCERDAITAGPGQRALPSSRVGALRVCVVGCTNTDLQTRPAVVAPIEEREALAAHIALGRGRVVLPAWGWRWVSSHERIGSTRAATAAGSGSIPPVRAERGSAVRRADEQTSRRRLF